MAFFLELSLYIISIFPFSDCLVFAFLAAMGASARLAICKCVSFKNVSFRRLRLFPTK